MASLNSRATIFRSSDRSMRHHSSPVGTVKSTAFNFTTGGNPASRMTPVVNLASYTTSDRGTQQHIDIDEEYGVKPPSVSSTHLSPTCPSFVDESSYRMSPCSAARSRVDINAHVWHPCISFIGIRRSGVWSEFGRAFDSYARSQQGFRFVRRFTFCVCMWVLGSVGMSGNERTKDGRSLGSCCMGFFLGVMALSWGTRRIIYFYLVLFAVSIAFILMYYSVVTSVKSAYHLKRTATVPALDESV